MKRTLLAWLLGGASMFGPMGAACAQADAEVALLKNVSGSVRILRDKGMLDAAVGTPLRVSDRLASGPGASAGIAFKDGTLLTLGPSTELQIRDYVFRPQESRYAFAAHLEKGSAIYSSGQIGKLAPEAVKVSSPTATVGVRGTRFLITAD